LAFSFDAAEKWVGFGSKNSIFGKLQNQKTSKGGTLIKCQCCPILLKLCTVKVNKKKQVATI
jgi:hypothetical protein